MVNILEKYLEVCLTIFVYIASATLTLTLLVFAREPIIIQGSDKTFVESTGIQQLYESDLYGRDILLMLLNTDIMAPQPKAIKLNNTPVIKIDSDFMAFQMDNIARIYSASGPQRLSVMLNYKVVSEEYVYSGPDSPYIHYVLQEVN